MDTISLIILGAVEGFTEFLPISSSGHLIFAHALLGATSGDTLGVDAVLQLAAGLAVTLYFWRDILRLIRSFFSWIFGKGIEKTDRILIVAIIVGTIPAIILGLLLENKMETVFRSPELVAWMLLVGTILLILGEQMGKRIAEKRPLSIKNGIMVGFFQCLALVPGVSRSGATISGGLILGLSREDAARFGFLLSIPIILGSGAKKVLELRSEHFTAGAPLFFGCVVSFAVGLACVHYLLKYLKSHTLNIFIIYRIALAVLVLGILYL
jgi:undecaprenyl-diphosphatase